MSEMIERVARALYERENAGNPFPGAAEHFAWDGPNFKGQNTWREMARVAIKVMREPTDEMCEAAYWHQQSDVNQYQDAIDAALCTANKPT